MNKLNYATLEASKRLVEAGVYLKTDVYHVFGVPCVNGRPPLMTRKELDALGRVSTVTEYLPAPSMAEVWRELPSRVSIEKYTNYSICGEMSNPVMRGQNINPTDALIDLLIWVKVKKGQ